ncbi:MAG: ROK family protein [Gemmatimonadota bacterium]
MRILVVDIGGTHVKLMITGRRGRVKFDSGQSMTPTRMMKQIRTLIRDWTFDVASIGYPGVVRDDAPAVEPHNLGRGWVGFDFASAFGRPVRLINDAAMQALGGYRGGTMLFLGLGTGLGSALVVDGTLAPLELGHLPRTTKHDYEHFVGEEARHRLGDRKWRHEIGEVMTTFRQAFLPDYIMLGGGNAIRLKRLPPGTRRSGKNDAFLGGSRLWQTPRSTGIETDIVQLRPRSRRRSRAGGSAG